MKRTYSASTNAFSDFNHSRGIFRGNTPYTRLSQNNNNTTKLNNFFPNYDTIISKESHMWPEKDVWQEKAEQLEKIKAKQKQRQTYDGKIIKEKVSIIVL